MSAPRPSPRLAPLSREELSDPVELTLHLRENPLRPSITTLLRAQQSTPAARRQPLSSGDLENLHGAHEVDIVNVREWAHRHDVAVGEVDLAGRRITVRAPFGQMAQHFGVQPVRERSFDGGYGELPGPRTVQGLIAPPTAIAGSVAGVVGLREGPVARPRLALLPRDRSPRACYTPEELADIYSFPMLPQGGAGTHLLVGIPELGGAVHPDDRDWFRRHHGDIELIEEGFGGGRPVADPFGADTEVALDWQVIAGILTHCAPRARISLVLRYAPNSERGFTDVMSSFATDGRPFAAVSTSWGSAESLWSSDALQAMDGAFQRSAARGIVHSNAAGDNGSADGVRDGSPHADHPASAPHAVACGGTTLLARRGQLLGETAWNEVARGQGSTGGGVSSWFPTPAWQREAGLEPRPPFGGRPGRGVPDVAANADPLTGYLVHHRGADIVVGGTSAVAPLWTAFFTLAGAITGHRLGHVLPALYGARGVGFRDVTSGDNGAYHAAPGWDPVTGLGSPDGISLCALLAGQQITRRHVAVRVGQHARVAREVGELEL